MISENWMFISFLVLFFLVIKICSIKWNKSVYLLKFYLFLG